MRYFITFFFACFFVSPVFAKKEKQDQVPRTEAELIGKIIRCLQFRDTNSYATLFINADSIRRQINAYRPKDQNESNRINQIRQRPDKVQQFDPYYNPEILRNYFYTLQKGEDSGIHWSRIIMVRYELEKLSLSRDLVGYELIAPFRLKGFVFIKDMATRVEYVFTVNEMHNISGHWYGGSIINIFEGTTIDDYNKKLAAENKRKRMMLEQGISEADLAKGDSSKLGLKENKIENDDDGLAMSKGLTKKEIVDRKLYKGTFDNEIQVKLYIRYIKGNCPEKICYWEAIYKFGDQDEYIKLEVSKTGPNKWLFLEDPPIGSMELSLKDRDLVGVWAQADIKTGYDVVLKEQPLSNEQVKFYDKIIKTGAWSRGGKDKDEE